MFKLALHWQILIGMAVGAAIGLTLNVTLSQRRSEVPEAALPEDIASIEMFDSVDMVEITITADDGQVTTLLVDPAKPRSEAFTTVDQLEAKHPEITKLFYTYGSSWARTLGEGANAIGRLFLRLLQMVAVPLIVTSLMTGVLGLGHAERLGRMFGRTILYYLSTSLIAITTGLILVNIINPGLNSGLNPQGGEAPDVAAGNLGQGLFDQLRTMIPPNPIHALAEGNFLSIIAFTLAFAIFALLVGGKTAELLGDFFNAAFEVMMRMTMAIIRLAPIGVLFLMLSVTATQGIGVFASLFWYMLTVFLALVFHAFVTMPLILYFVARRNPWEYIRALSPALLTAFSSASSNATLPLTMACVEERAGVSNRVSSFVLPLGATVNMDGTALYEAVAVLFIAQLYHGAALPITQQIIVALTALLASIGAAGIPNAGVVMMIVILQAVGLPLELQGTIIAVDRVLDMCRTSVNVWSDSCGCAVVSRFEVQRSREAKESLLEEPEHEFEESKS
jgi:proton glutamate symport protein